MSIQVSDIDVWGFKHAIRGMRNPKNSWDRSDSVDSYNGVEYPIGFGTGYETEMGMYTFRIGPNDLKLMHELFVAGPEHRKFVRQIFVSLDITAPFYWWKEFDTYKIGTTANSTSTMHRIHAKNFVLEDFSCEHLDDYSLKNLKQTIDTLNFFRNLYVGNTGVDEYNAYADMPKKEIWWQLIQLLPTTYNQTRTITMSYENVINMIHQREFHKLDEWRLFIEHLKRLPYMEAIRQLRVKFYADNKEVESC